MIYILVKYALPYHKKEEYDKLYESHAKAVEKYGGKIIGVWNVEMGPALEHILIWAAEDWNVYERVLQMVAKDPEDAKWRELARPMISDYQRWLLRPTPQSPLK